MPHRRGLLLVALLASCARTDRALAERPSPNDSNGASQVAPMMQAAVAGDVRAAKAVPAAAAEAQRPLTLVEARRYMLTLINRDRGSQGLAAVALDEGPPSRGGQRHAEDMAKHGFLGHWGTDGSVPEQRYSEAGGTDFVTENASCIVDEATRELAKEQRFDPKMLERAEALFFNETPPNDGHRKNILSPRHHRVGIGLALPVAAPNEIMSPCITQEFIDPYGAYAPVPRKAHVGEVVRVEGTLREPAQVTAVGLSRIDTPKPIGVAEANKRRVYPTPAPYVTYWPQGYKTPLPLAIEGNRFQIAVPLSDAKKPGLYGVSVWAKLPGSSDNVMVSLRTILVE